MGAEKRPVATAQKPKAEPKPRNAYYVAARAALRSLFPREALAQELERRGLSRGQAARQGGVNLTAMQRWFSGKHVPLARTLRRFLDNLGIEDRQPYESFLAAQGPVTLVCPRCGKPRLLERGQLKGVATDARGRRELKQLADGSYELPCGACSRQIRGAALKRDNNRRLRARFGTKADYLLDAADAGDQDAREKLRRLRSQWMIETPEQRARRLERVRTARRGPRTEAFRLACALAGVVTRAANGFLKRPFYLCPLCGLVTHTQRWHRPCWDTWRVWYQRNVGGIPERGVLPPPLRKRGPKPEKHLARNYRWLMARRDPKGRENCRQLLSAAAKKLKSKATVVEGIKAFIRLLPGSWDLVFSESPSTRRTNIGRQELAPLTLELERRVGPGGRDNLIRRLLEFGMAEEKVARLTGMGLPKVKGINAGLRSELASSG